MSSGLRAEAVVTAISCIMQLIKFHAFTTQESCCHQPGIMLSLAKHHAIISQASCCLSSARHHVIICQALCQASVMLWSKCHDLISQDNRCPSRRLSGQYQNVNTAREHSSSCAQTVNSSRSRKSACLWHIARRMHSEFAVNVYVVMQAVGHNSYYSLLTAAARRKEQQQPCGNSRVHQTVKSMRSCADNICCTQLFLCMVPIAMIACKLSLIAQSPIMPSEICDKYREAGYTEKWEEAPATVEGRSQSWPACDTCSPVTEGHRQIDSAMKFSSHRAPFSMGSHGCNTSIRDMLMQPSFKSGTDSFLTNMLCCGMYDLVLVLQHYSNQSSQVRRIYRPETTGANALRAVLLLILRHHQHEVYSITFHLHSCCLCAGSGDSVYNITANANKAVPAPSHYSWIGRQPTTLAGNQHATHDNTHDSINIWQQPDQASAPATSSQLNSQNWTAEPHMGNSGQHVASLMSHVGSKSHMGSRSRHMGISDDMNGFKQSRDETKQLSDMHSRQLNTQLPQLSSERRYAVATDSNMKLSAQHDPQLHSQPSSTSHVGVHVDDSPLGLRAQSDSQLGAQVNNQSLAQPYVSQLSFERYASSQNLSTDGSQSNAQPPMHQMSSFPQTGNHGLAEDVKTELNTHLRNGLPTPMLQPGCEYLNDAEALL